MRWVRGWHGQVTWQFSNSDLGSSDAAQTFRTRLSWELKTTEVDFFLYTHFDMHISGREESIFRSMIITNKLGSYFLEGVRRHRGKNLILNSWPAEHLLIDFWQDEILTSGTEIFKLKSVKFNYFLIKIQHFKLEMNQVLNSIPLLNEVEIYEQSWKVWTILDYLGLRCKTLGYVGLRWTRKYRLFNN